MPDNYPNTRIKKLSPLLINQLAAGEVVTRPAAVVKELLENAIDAGAYHIEVHITQGGMGMIEVMDDGVGIHPDDMVMAITRHATSKVADVANLHGITTLGFRGEALAATAAVSRLTLTSSHDDSGIGRQLQVAGVLEDIPKLIPIVHKRGTTVTVKDIYFNVPARRGNLKSIATEFGHIETIVREVALARADVALTLFHDNKKRLSLSAKSINSSNENPNRLPLSRLEQATGALLTPNALEVVVDLSSLVQQPMGPIDNNYSGQQASISGWLWPSTDSQNTLPKLLYVNGRLVKEPIVNNQLRQLAHKAGAISIGYALYFDLPIQWLNVNVHPSKQRIKISPLNNIMAHLSHAVRLKLKTVITTQTMVPADSHKKRAPETKTAITKSFDDLSFNTSTTNDLGQGRQVQAPKQPYQTSKSKPFSIRKPDSHTKKPYIDELSESRVNVLNMSLDDSVKHLTSSNIATKFLPVCLDIIHSMDSGISKFSNTEAINNKSLPWLLFYNQSQCLLISAEGWQSKMRVLFESHILDNEAFKRRQLPDSPIYINQQLATISTQMSAQDLVVFIADMEEILFDEAIINIDRNQLVSFMLSSTSE
ncbi:DNA mismatch repair endonuclease MutL [Psychrobacter sp. 1U1]|uniref:DNA mismatch repair endonuclease MutL n=1 Tax=Psychrobacter sp. 1U1 TaxID=3453576 RepID=UPI003F486D3F